MNVQCHFMHGRSDKSHTRDAHGKKHLTSCFLTGIATERHLSLILKNDAPHVIYIYINKNKIDKYVYIYIYACVCMDGWNPHQLGQPATTRLSRQGAL